MKFLKILIFAFIAFGLTGCIEMAAYSLASGVVGGAATAVSLKSFEKTKQGLDEAIP